MMDSEITGFRRVLRRQMAVFGDAKQGDSGRWTSAQVAIPACLSLKSGLALELVPGTNAPRYPDSKSVLGTLQLAWHVQTGFTGHYSGRARPWPTSQPQTA